MRKKGIGKTRKRKIKYKRILLTLLVFTALFYCGYEAFSGPITNIFIEGNRYLSDQTIIELVNISNYPSSFKVSPSKIEEILEDNIYIKKAEVSKKGFKEIYIKVTENKPLLYSEMTKKTILFDGQNVSSKFEVPVLVNEIPNDMLERFLNNLSEVNDDVFGRISEIKYDPNIDIERFLFTMIDGNYVYIDVNKLANINDYLNIIKNFPNKKGILYLDSGSHFQVIEQ